MSDRIVDVLAHKGMHVERTHPRTTILAAVKRMNELRIGALLVTDSDREEEIDGILTERDILTRVVARQVAAETTLVADVMTRTLVTIDVHASIAEAMVIMTNQHLRHLPVVDNGEVCGLVSIGDLMSYLVRDQEWTIHDLHEYICHP